MAFTDAFRIRSRPKAPTSIDQANTNPTAQQGIGPDPAYVEANTRANRLRDAALAARSSGNIAAAQDLERQRQVLLDEMELKYGTSAVTSVRDPDRGGQYTLLPGTRTTGTQTSTGQLSTRLPTPAGELIGQARESGVINTNNANDAVARVQRVVDQYTNPAAPTPGPRVTGAPVPGRDPVQGSAPVAPVGSAVIGRQPIAPDELPPPRAAPRVTPQAITAAGSSPYNTLDQGGGNQIGSTGRAPANIANRPTAAAQSQFTQFDPGTVGGNTPNYAAQGAAAAQRVAPQIRETGNGAAAQQSALSQAQSFQPDTSGIAGIRAATADTSGAAALSNFQSDMTSVNRLDSYQPSRADAGIRDLQSFDPTASMDAARGLQNFNPSETLQGVQMLQNFRTTGADQALNNLDQFNPANAGIAPLSNFNANTSGIDRLNAFAGEAQGPSAAQALLNSQSDKDVRSAIALARSARGGPAAVAQAQRQAQSEGAAIQAETRGQAAALSAQEYDTYKQRQLLALGQAGQLLGTAEGQRMQALQAAGTLISTQNAQDLQRRMAQGEILSAADAQRLSAFQSAAQQLTAASGQRLSAEQAAAQVISAADAQRLQAKVAAGQMLTAQDQQILSAMTSARQRGKHQPRRQPHQSAGPDRSDQRRVAGKRPADPGAQRPGGYLERHPKRGHQRAAEQPIGAAPADEPERYPGAHVCADPGGRTAGKPDSTDQRDSSWSGCGHSGQRDRFSVAEFRGIPPRC